MARHARKVVCMFYFNFFLLSSLLCRKHWYVSSHLGARLSTTPSVKGDSLSSTKKGKFQKCILTCINSINIYQEINVGKAQSLCISVAVSTIFSKKSKENVQTKSFANSPNPISHLNIAIADCINGNSHPFRLIKDRKFKVPSNDPQAAKYTPSRYVTSTQATIDDMLLVTTYNPYMAKVKSEIENDADLLVFTIYGDGVTIDKSPMINVMISIAYNPQALCNVIDCSNNMTEGGIEV